MMNLFENLSPDAGPILLAAAFLLGFGGITMLLYSAYIRTQIVARRVSLVEPKHPRTRTPSAEQSGVRPTLSLGGELTRMPEAEQREAVRILGLFGIPAAYGAMALVIARVLAAVVVGGFGFVLGSLIPVLAASTYLHFALGAVAAFVGWLMPVYALQYSAASRAKQAEAGLPDALELLVICVEVGLALEDAIDRSVSELKHSNPVLAYELAMTSADLKVLPSQDLALQRLADRLNVSSVRSVVTTLSQTLRLGTPLAQALRVVAAELRNDALLAIEERANRLPTLLTLPMMLFIMPTIFLVIAGPAALRVADTFFK